MDIIIISNGPGELASWVKPTVKSLKNRQKDIRIVLLLPPCPFSSGQEEQVAKSISGIDLVLNSRKFFELLFLGKTGEFIPDKKGLVVLLGGDTLHALSISRRLGLSSILYTEKADWDNYWNNYFCYCLVSNERIKNKLIKYGTRSEIIRVVGNMITEGIEVTLSRENALRAWGLLPDSLTLGILPGSRPEIFKVTLPYFLRVSEQIYEKIPATQFLLALSPHISIDIIRESLSRRDDIFERTSGKVHNDINGNYLVTERGLMVRIIEHMQHDVINASDLILSIPGTVNAEAAFLGVPMMVIYSFSHPGLLQLGGIPGLLGSIPILGPFLKRNAARRILKLIKFLSPPNILADREIIPEINVLSKADEVSSIAISLLSHPEKRDIMSQEFKKIFSDDHPSEKVAHIILETLESLI